MDIKEIIFNNLEPVIETNQNKYTYDISMVGNTLLQNYLSILYPNEKKNNKITNDTIEELMRDGIHNKLRKSYTEEELELNKIFNYELNDNWILTTTSDTVITKIYDDNILTLTIYSNKFVYNEEIYTLEKQYTNEFNFNKFIILENKKETHIDDEEFKINFFIKDITNTIKNESFLCFSPKEINNVDFIIEIEKTTFELQKFIESGNIPDVCTDLMWQEIDYEYVPTKCLHLCSQSKNCPYFDNETYEVKKL